MSKFIFVTGGVVSGLGKGVSAASIGRLLKARGYSIFVQKLDPYLNIDPGTMSPYEHGEVYVTEDGGETDLDLGHYERFIGTDFNRNSNFTSGQIYMSILNNERQGQYKGKTVQIVPHVTKYIEKLIKNASKNSKADFVITEIGGTVGDIESKPFVYALAEFSNKFKESAFFIHVTYVPYLEAAKEFKSKPTQRSIAELRQFGINPNLILLRSNKRPNDEIIKKTSVASLLPLEAIVGLPNSNNVYKVPLILEDHKIAQQILKYFKMKNRRPKLDDWKNFVNLIDIKKEKTIEIAMIGKYVEFPDAYMSIIEALKISAIYAGVDIKFKWIQSSNINKNNIKKKMMDVNGVVILPGFGERGFAGKVIASTYLRKTKIPVLGICYGMQAMTVAQAKVVGIKDAISTENSEIGTPVIDLIRDTNSKKATGGTLRLGKNETTIVKGTLAHKIYNSDLIFERHRHRYEINPEYVQKLETNGFVFSGFNPKTGLAEIIEYNKHPFYIGTQYHPEFTSKPLLDHPLFKAFINAQIKK
ncbi:MAG: CTP synthase [Mycoplasmatales bacterium]|nr:CTP synthase [Mycoplasmatales bacterium]